jgi:16S rRNA (guanine527-N7)-methyltransferase
MSELPPDTADAVSERSFEEELDAVLPADLPNRNAVLAGGAHHLRLIVEANRQFNLTRITGSRDAAVKHVFDSVLPWKHFASAGRVLDAGSGAGFPGIPLALVLPQVDFVLCESIGKKARFLESAISELKLSNVRVSGARAEELLRTQRVDVITARAVAPLKRAVALFGPALRKGTRALLYKGPDAESEIAEAAPELAKLRLRSRVVESYSLPDEAGIRTLIEVAARH